MKTVKVTLCDPLDYNNTFNYNIIPYNNELANDWVVALEEIIESGIPVDNQFCHLGWKYSPRNVEFLCKRLRECKDIVNEFPWDYFGLDDYKITDEYTPETVVVDNRINHDVCNQLHNHFEILNGTVENPSPYLQAAQKWPVIEIEESTGYSYIPFNQDLNTKTTAAIKDLNLYCHELESFVNSYYGEHKPTTIVQWFQAKRYPLKENHRNLFDNGYHRRFGEVYMHWSQVGKTLMEVYMDENAPELTESVCEAITHLKYYSGMFDIHWGHRTVWEPPGFREWLKENGYDPYDKQLSLGYLPIGQVDFIRSFGTTDQEEIRKTYSKYLHIKSIEVNDC